jgi:hypothetical protein
VPVPAGPVVTVASIDLDGATEAVDAVGRLDPAEADAVIREATARAGVRVDEATLGDGLVRLRLGDLEVEAGSVSGTARSCSSRRAGCHRSS